MIRKLNRAFQDYMREKRLKIGKIIWDKKEKEEIKKGNNFIKDNNIKSILFMRYDGKIGDMVVNTFMFREIKKVYPEIKIGVVTKGAAKDIIRDNPNVDKIYDYEKSSRKIKKIAKEISEEKYDLLIDFSEMLRVNQMMLINLCKARFNFGLNREDWNLFDLSLKSGVDFEWTEHITKRYVAYLEKLGFIKETLKVTYDIFLTDKDSDKYKEFLKKIESKNILVLNPYGASKHKSFSIETLDKIIKFLKSLDVAVVLLYFGNKIRELEVLKNGNSNLYIPEEIKTIQDSSNIIKFANYVITPDTSIVHIAVALNKKTLSVYPPKGGKFGVDHLVWGPLGEKNIVIFCKDKKSQYSEIDINTFDFEEMKKEILNMVK